MASNSSSKGCGGANPAVQLEGSHIEQSTLNQSSIGENDLDLLDVSFDQMDSQFDCSFTELLMWGSDFDDDAMQTNPAVLTPVQNEVAPRVDKAKEMFAKIIGRPFQYKHCWNLLKMEQKWTDNFTSNKRAKTYLTGSPAESNHVESCYSTPYLRDDIEPSSTPNLDRPLDRKVSKKQFKNKEKQTGVEASLDHYYWNQKMEVERQKVERYDKIYVQQEIELEQHRRQLEIEERQVQEIERQNEMKIMETDTTGMDSISAIYWNNLKMEIMKKRGFNF